MRGARARQPVGMRTARGSEWVHAQGDRSRWLYATPIVIDDGSIVFVSHVDDVDINGNRRSDIVVRRLDADALPLWEYRNVSQDSERVQCVAKVDAYSFLIVPAPSSSPPSRGLRLPAKDPARVLRESRGLRRLRTIKKGAGPAASRCRMASESGRVGRRRAGWT